MNARYMLVIKLPPAFVIDTLDRYGVEGWNTFIQKLNTENIINPVFSVHEPPPVALLIKPVRLNMRERDLQGVDFSELDLFGCDFTNANLKKAKFGIIRNSRLSGADLTRTEFDGEISGCNFSNARLSHTTFADFTWYKTEDPPRGLPEEVEDILLAWSPNHPLRGENRDHSGTDIEFDFTCDYLYLNAECHLELAEFADPECTHTEIIYAD